MNIQSHYLLAGRLYRMADHYRLGLGKNPTDEQKACLKQLIDLADDHFRKSWICGRDNNLFIRYA